MSYKSNVNMIDLYECLSVCLSSVSDEDNC